jgi:hypothetical protein
MGNARNVSMKYLTYRVMKSRQKKKERLEHSVGSVLVIGTLVIT